MAYNYKGDLKLALKRHRKCCIKIRSVVITKSICYSAIYYMSILHAKNLLLYINVLTTFYQLI